MEITENELRIGNWYIGYDNKPKQWTLKDFSLLTHADGVRALDLDEMIKSQIPLTEQWLLDFGFIKDGNGHWWKNLVTHYLELIEMNKWFFPVFVELPELSIEQEQRVGLPRIGSVHELQNLFFALTGTELTKK